MDENWDDELGLTESLKPLKISLQPLLHLKDDNNSEKSGNLKSFVENDQGNDDFETSAVPPQNNITIVGRQANTNESEDWDDEDFALEEDKLGISRGLIRGETRNNSISEMSKSKSLSLMTYFNCVVSNRITKSPTVLEEMEEDEEDWDHEIFGESVMRTGLGGLLQQEQAHDEENGLVPIYHQFPEVKQQPKIVKYPKPPSLRTLKMPDGLKHISENALENWIMDLVEKHRRESTASNIDPSMVKDLSSKEAFSIEWCIALFHHYFVYYRQNYVKECSDLLGILFEESRNENALKQLSSAKAQKLVETATRMLSYHVKLCPINEIAKDQGFGNLKSFSIFFSISVDILELESMCHWAKCVSVLDDAEKRLKKLYTKLESVNNLNEDEQILLKFNVLLDLECINYTLSPLTTEQLDISDDTIQEAESVENSPLDDLDYRLLEITHLYQRLPLSFLKAKGAFMLALMHNTSFKDTAISEQFAFECLYILDSLPNILKSSPGILSSLGYNALKLFGELLQANQKHLFAISAMCASVENLKFRRKTVNFSTLVNIGHLCAECFLYEKSVHYYIQAIQGCQQSSRLNEIVHLTMICGRIMLSDGKLRDFEQIISDSMDYLQNLVDGKSPNLLANDVRSTAQIISNVSKLRLFMAEEYLKLEDFESAILVVEKAIIDGAFMGHLDSFMVVLATAYLKMGWERESLEILRCFKSLKGVEYFELIHTNSSYANGDTLKLISAIQDFCHHGGIDVSNSQLRADILVVAIEFLFSTGSYIDAQKLLISFHEEFPETSNFIEHYVSLGKLVALQRSKLPEDRIMPQTTMTKSSSFSVLPKFQTRRPSNGSTLKARLKGSAKSPSMSDLSNEKSDVDYLCDSIKLFQRAHSMALIASNEHLRLVSKIEIYDALLTHLLIECCFEQNASPVDVELSNFKELEKNFINLKSIISECGDLLSQAVHAADLMLTLKAQTLLARAYTLQKQCKYSLAYVSEFSATLKRFFDAPVYLSVLSRSNQLELLEIVKAALVCLTVAKEIEGFQTNLPLIDFYFQFESEIRTTKTKCLSDSKQLIRDGVFSSVSKSERLSENSSLTKSHLKLVAGKKSLSMSSENFQNTFSTANTVSSTKSRTDISSKHVFPDIIAEGSNKHEDDSSEEEEGDNDSIMTFTAPTESKKSIRYKNMLNKLKNIYISNRKSSIINGRYIFERCRSCWTDWELTKQHALPENKTCTQISIGNSVIIFEYSDFFCFICLKAGIITWFRMTTPLKQIAPTNDSEQSSLSVKKSTLGKKERLKKGQIQYTVVKIIFVHKQDIYALLEVPLTNSLEDCIDVIFSTVGSSTLNVNQSDGSIVSSDSASTDSSNTPPLSKSLSRKASISSKSEDAQKKPVRILDMNQKARVYVESLKGGMFSSRDEFVLSTKSLSEKNRYEALSVNTRAPIGETSLVEQFSQSNEEPLTFYFVSLNDISYPNGRSEAIIQTKRKHLSFVQSIVSESRTDDNPSSGQFAQVIREMRTTTFGRIQATLLKMFGDYENLNFTQDFAEKFVMPLVCSKACALYPWELILRAGHVVRTNTLLGYVNNDIIAKDMKNAIVVRSMVKFFAVYYGEECPEYRHDRSRRLYDAQISCSEISNNRIKKPLEGKDFLFKTPFQSPLVKQSKHVGTYKKRYKYIKFLDLKKIDSPARLPNAIAKSFAKQNYPVFLLTFADLSEMNQWTQEALTCEKASTTLFIPALHFKIVLKRLLDNMDEVLNKSGSSGTGQKKTVTTLEPMSSKFFTPAPTDADMTFQLASDSESSGLTPEEEVFWRRFIRQLAHSIQLSMEIPIAIYETKGNK